MTKTRTPSDSNTVPLMVRLPKDIHKWIKTLSEKEHRSLNAQIVVILQKEKEKDTTATAHQ